MEKENGNIFYVLNILKADNTKYRTIVKLISSDKGRVTYLDIISLKTISSLAMGNRALIFYRSMNCTPIDRITECYPFHPAFISSETGKPLDFENTDEATRVKAVNTGLEAFDWEQQEKLKRKEKPTPIRIK